MGTAGAPKTTTTNGQTPCWTSVRFSQRYARRNADRPSSASGESAMARARLFCSPPTLSHSGSRLSIGESYLLFLSLECSPESPWPLLLGDAALQHTSRIVSFRRTCRRNLVV